MAHNLNFKNGVASFASKKEVAWHGLGTVVEAMTSAEAIQLGGLDFEVEKRPIYINSTSNYSFEDAKQKLNINRKLVKDGEGGLKSLYSENLIIPNQYATVRTDLDIPLGIVGSKYEVIQNSEAFDFIDSIIGQGVADYETVGALGNGETVFITCKLKESMVINKDLIDKYLLITMSHDGSSSIVVMFTPIRVVCNNTLSLALGTNNNKVTIRHTKNARDKMELAKKVLGIVDIQSNTYQEAFGNLFNTKVSDPEAKFIIERAFKLERDVQTQELSSRGQNVLDTVFTYYQEGIGQVEIIGTGYGVFNAITGYLQNVKEYKSDDLKFKNTFLGTGLETRNIAYNLLINI